MADPRSNPDNTARRLAQGDHIETRWSDAMPWPEPPVRRSLCYEGVRTVDGRYLNVDSLVFPDEPIPVTCLREVGIVGKAQGFKREPANVSVPELARLITGQIWLHPVYGEGIDLDQRNVHIEIDDVTYDREGDEPRIKSARLRGIFLSSAPGSWPSLDVVHSAIPAVEEPTIFTAPYTLGNAYGPGKGTRTCTRCGLMILDEPKWLDVHRKAHATGWTRA